MSYAAMHRFPEAIKEARQFLKDDRPVSEDANGYAQLFAAAKMSEMEPATALAFAVAGNRDKAFSYLEKAYSQGSSELIMDIRCAGFDPLRSDPRYKDLMRRLGLPE
jgi:TPR repeat protein